MIAVKVLPSLLFYFSNNIDVVQNLKFSSRRILRWVNCYIITMIYVSHRSHKSHEEHLLSLVLTSGMYTLGEADKRGRSDAPSVRFVRSFRFAE